jgi:hypothetical protein
MAPPDRQREPVAGGAMHYGERYQRRKYEMRPMPLPAVAAPQARCRLAGNQLNMRRLATILFIRIAGAFRCNQET